ncbi:MAG: hypothetical protein AAFV19_00780 [Pseudomonadota bacterium]
MTSLLLQIAFYLGIMFVLGILFGWLLWGRDRAAAMARVRAIEEAAQNMRHSHGDAQVLADALARVNAEKTALEQQLAERSGA